jgi:peptidyl-prolyl cis-trans isomerase A (cyclophilin A)
VLNELECLSGGRLRDGCHSRFSPLPPALPSSCLSDFVVQFGIASQPNETAKWDNSPIEDDPVVRSNTFGYVSFATSGPNTRTTQIFVNLANNSRLDAEGFAPFARVVSGMDTVLALANPTPGDSDGVDQGNYTMLGNPWILEYYPDVDLILRTELDAAAPTLMEGS